MGREYQRVYKLKLDDIYLGFEGHGDGTEILIKTHNRVAEFETFEQAYSTICTDFYFHHGCGSINMSSTAKERLEKIQIVKEVITIEREVVPFNTYLHFIPNNEEMAKYYLIGLGDDGLQRMIDNGSRQKDDYDFSDSVYRIEGYNEWVSQGRPSKSGRDKARLEAAKNGQN